MSGLQELRSTQSGDLNSGEARGEFAGKVAVITGGGTGIGRDTARALLDRGARVVINGRRESVLEEAAAALDPSGERIRTFAGDIRRKETATGLASFTVEAFGGIDILINNAGIFRPTTFLDHTEGDFANYVEIILGGTFFASQAVIPHLQQRGGGAIVNTGSIWALQAIGATPSSAYSAAKAGVHALTRNLAIEFSGDGIRVNAVAPAVVETPVYNTFLSEEEVEATLPTFNEFHPLGRNGQPRDVTEAILFLASPRSGWITGTIVPVDGGVTAGKHAA